MLGPLIERGDGDRRGQLGAGPAAAARPGRLPRGGLLQRLPRPGPRRRRHHASACSPSAARSPTRSSASGGCGCCSELCARTRRRRTDRRRRDLRAAGRVDRRATRSTCRSPASTCATATCCAAARPGRRCPDDAATAVPGRTLPTTRGGCGPRRPVAAPTVPAPPSGSPARRRVGRPGDARRSPCRCPSATRTRPLGVAAGRCRARAAPSTSATARSSHLLAQQVAVAVRNAQAYQEERDRADGAGRAGPGQDRLLHQRQPRVPHPADPDARPARRRPRRHRPSRSAPAQRERVDTARRNADPAADAGQQPADILQPGGRARPAPRRARVDLAAAHRRPGRGVPRRRRAGRPAPGRRLPAAAAPGRGRPGHWEKIVTNLLSNALKFTFVGEIRVTLDADDDGVRLRVADTGIGIAAGRAAAALRPVPPGAAARGRAATRAPASAWRWSASCARLVGGDVEVSSAPGEGTTFTVALPWTAVGAGGDSASCRARARTGWPAPAPR